MKKIYFDLTATQPDVDSKRHGGGKYGEVLLKRIIERGLPLICGYDSRRWLNPDIKHLIHDKNIPLFDVCKTSENEIIKNEGIELYYTASVTNEKLKLNCCDVIGTLHGLRGLETPVDVWSLKYRPYFRNLKLYIKNKLRLKILHSKYRMMLGDIKLLKAICDSAHFKIVTVSFHSAYSIKSYYADFRMKDIPVFYPPSTTSDNTPVTKYTDKYFLLVSANRTYKNCLRAIVALDELFSDGGLDGYNVKVTGVCAPSIYRYKIKNKDRFNFMGFVDDDELEQLNHDAYCLIYPSLNEGFGYPPLEAMRYGIPVIASPLTSISEVCGESVIYFNPFSIEELKSRLLMMTDTEIHKQYSKKGYSRYLTIHEKQEKDLDLLIDYLYNIKRQ